MAVSEKNKPVALITGGASFLGSAVSRKLADQGFRLGLHYQGSASRAQKLASELSASGVETLLLQGDLRLEKTTGLMVEKITRRFKRLDLLVNNASMFNPTPLQSSKRAQWEEIFQINLFAPYALCQAAAPWLRKSKGSVVQLTDIYGDHPILRGYSAYCSSKAGLIALTKNLALELGPDVRVNAVSPGAIFIPKSYTLKQRKELTGRSALKRAGRPEEIAEAVYFMATQSFVTGQVLNVDGGRFF
jgi:pteridine reductase